MTTPTVYTPGSIKVDPISRTVAVRTDLPGTSTQNQDWCCMTTGQGGYFCGYDKVAGWPDILYAPIIVASNWFSGGGALTGATLVAHQAALSGVGALTATAT